MADKNPTSAQSVDLSASDPASKSAGCERSHPVETWLQQSIAKWLSATAQAESVVSGVRVQIGQNIAALQISIMSAQDNLSPDNKAGQQALLRLVDLAETLNQTARRFDRLIADLAGLAAIENKLADRLTALYLKSPASFVAPMPNSISNSAVN